VRIQFDNNTQWWPSGFLASSSKSEAADKDEM